MATLLPGEEAFLIVPTQVNSRLTLRSVNGVPTTVNDPRPDESSPTVDISALNPFLGEDQIVFAANEPPEEALDLAYTIEAGRPSNSANLRADIQLAPHFRLLAGSFDVPRNSTITLRCEDAAGTLVDAATATVTPSADTEVTIAGSSVSIEVRTNAAPGPRRVLVEDGSAPTRRARRTISVV